MHLFVKLLQSTVPDELSAQRQALTLEARRYRATVGLVPRTGVISGEGSIGPI